MDREDILKRKEENKIKKKLFLESGLYKQNKRLFIKFPITIIISILIIYFFDYGLYLVVVYLFFLNINLELVSVENEGHKINIESEIIELNEKISLLEDKLENKNYPIL